MFCYSLIASKKFNLVFNKLLNIIYLNLTTDTTDWFKNVGEYTDIFAYFSRVLRVHLLNCENVVHYCL